MNALRHSLALVLVVFAAGCSDDDTSTSTGTDTGTTVTDTGTTPKDTSTTPQDTSTTPADTGTTPMDTSVTDTAPAPTTHKVTVGASGSNTFAPASLTIKVGDSVEWEWMGVAHTVTESMGTACTAKSGGFDSGLQNTGFKFTQKFTAAGTVNYMCTPHCSLGMKGTITVE